MDSQRLLEIIRDSPNLVSLVLNDAGPNSPANDSLAIVPSAVCDVVISKVDTRSLTTIQLHALRDLAPLLSFLERLRTPKLQCLSISHVCPVISSIHDILPRTLSFDAQLDSCNSLTLAVDVYSQCITVEHSLVEELNATTNDEPEYISLRCPRKMNSSFKNVVRCSDNIEKFSEDGDAATYSQLSLTFLRRLCPHPENIRALSLKDAVWDIQFAEVFVILSQVQCVELWNDIGTVLVKGFITFLLDGAEVAESQENGPALPSVQTLIFDTVQFDDDDIENLRFFLAHRMNRKKPISHLGLNHCNGIDAGRLSGMGGLVGSLWVVDNDVMV